MGLKLTLSKTMNHMYADFTDAYWYLQEIEYSTTQVGFSLVCYPSRESKDKQYQSIEEKLPIGGAVDDVYRPKLYQWNGVFPVSSIFPNGIPLDENSQKTAIYNFIKEYTQLPWKDVIEK